MITRIRTWIFPIFLLFSASLIVLIAGCKSAVERYGAETSDQTITKIENITADFANFDGKTVKVAGQIINECPGGHWFNLKGEKAVIYVTLSGFTLPQKVGQTVVVEGDVINEGGRLTILGKGVEIK